MFGKVPFDRDSSVTGRQAPGDNHPKELIRSILLRGSGGGRDNAQVDARARTRVKARGRCSNERNYESPEREPAFCQSRKIVTLIVLERRARDALRGLGRHQRVGVGNYGDPDSWRGT